MSKKIALCFLITKDIRNFKVWEDWWQGYENKFNFYAHYSKGREEYVKNRYISSHRVPPIPTKWGDISLVKAEKQLYNKAYKDKSNKFFLLLSDTCIPVRPFMYVYNRLMRDTNKGLGPWRNLGYAGVDEDDYEPFIKSPICQEKMLLMHLLNSNLYALDQWKALSRRNVKDFLDMWKNKTYVSIFTKCIEVIPESLAPDELMFINYINYKYHGKGGVRSQIRSAGFTYVDFDKKAIHPLKYKTLSRKLKNNICSIDAMFARKFYRHNSAISREMPVKCKYGKSISKGRKKSRSRSRGKKRQSRSSRSRKSRRRNYKK